MIVKITLDHPSGIADHVDPSHSMSMAHVTEDQHVPFAVQPLAEVRLISGTHSREVGHDERGINRVGFGPFDSRVVRLHLL